MPGSIGELPCAYVRFNSSTWCVHMPCAGGVSEPATVTVVRSPLPIPTVVRNNADKLIFIVGASIVYARIQA